MRGTLFRPELTALQVQYDPETKTLTPESALPGWVHSSKLVVKPDCLIKRRGKAGLLLLNAEWPEAQKWIEARAGKPVNVRAELAAARMRLCWALRASSALAVDRRLALTGRRSRARSAR